MGERRTDREDHGRGILHRQAESGQSVASFCRQEFLSAASFYSWRRKLNSSDGGASPRQLLPVRIESSRPPASVRILLPQGVAIDTPTTIDPGVLSDLLRVIGEAYRC